MIDDTDKIHVWDKSAQSWIDLWMYDNRYYLSSNATSTTLTFYGASEFKSGWYVCVMNDEKTECVQVQSIDGNTLTVSSMSNYSSFTTANNTFVYKFDATRHDLTSNYTGGTTIQITATPYFEAEDEIFVTDGTNLEKSVISSISTAGGTTTITIEDEFQNDYLTSNNSYIFTRPKFGRWRKAVSGTENDSWAAETENLGILSPGEGVVIERPNETKEGSIAIMRPYERN